MEQIRGKPEEIVTWLFKQDRKKLFICQEYKEKRSLTANAYAWSLISKIADALRAAKDEIYITMLKRYGQSEIISVLSDVNIAGYFKYYDIAGKSHLNGREFTHYHIYKGSSEYSTAEMSILIDGIISEAKLLGIETLPDYEIKKLKNMWGA